ncbi:IclR family transcriptional regulator [Streptomyces sp. NPDC002426]
MGRTTPLNCTATGRALLSGLADAEAEALLVTGGDARLPGTDAAPRDVPAVLERLRTERARGYAVAVEEMEPGLIAVAAPVRDHRGDVVAALNVSAPVFRLPPDAVPKVVEAVVAASHRLSARLGGGEPVA